MGSGASDEYGAGESFSFPGSGIHRMEHDRGAVTIHVYSPPISAIGHYDVVDGELRRESGPPDQGSPPSPGTLDRVCVSRPAEASSSAYVIEMRPRAPVTPSS